MFPVFLVLLMVKTALSLPADAYVGRDGTVGASFGGYSASAGLGGLLGGDGAKGGLHAEAGTPLGHHASAGLSGSTGGQGNPGYILTPNGNQAAPQNPQKSFFDDIFNIPISTLGAVNQYLNNRRKLVAVRSPVPDSGASSQASGTSNAEAPQYYVKPNTKYDDIFNIPISVLGSVNKFLNGN